MNGYAGDIANQRTTGSGGSTYQWSASNYHDVHALNRTRTVVLRSFLGMVDTLIRPFSAPADAAILSKAVKKRTTDPGVRVQVCRIEVVCGCTSYSCHSTEVIQGLTRFEAAGRQDIRQQDWDHVSSGATHHYLVAWHAIALVPCGWGLPVTCNAAHWPACGLHAHPLCIAHS